MSYSIQYGSTSFKTRLKRIRGTKKIRKVQWWIAICVVIFSLILGRMGLLDFLIPGDNDATKNAFSDMVSDVRNGESVKSAVTAFCNEILSVGMNDE